MERIIEAENFSFSKTSLSAGEVKVDPNRPGRRGAVVYSLLLQDFRNDPNMNVRPFPGLKSGNSWS
jgi:hypothetical protein